MTIMAQKSIKRPWQGLSIALFYSCLKTKTSRREEGILWFFYVSLPDVTRKGICKQMPASCSSGHEGAAVLLLGGCQEGDLEGEILQTAEKSPPRKGRESGNKSVRDEDAQVPPRWCIPQEKPSLGTCCNM